MESNREVAGEVSSLLKSRGIFMVDIISSPGSGKTTLLDSLVSRLKGEFRIAVIIGDIKTTRDAQRIIGHDIPVIQIETDRFNRDCHLHSSWIQKCLESFDLDATDIIFIENIGNLVCPAEFELGEDEKITVLSVPEGEDKPVKYPQSFFAASTAVINKIDLLPYLKYDIEQVITDIKNIKPQINLFRVSALNGTGMDEFSSYIAEKARAKRSAVSAARK